MADPHRNPAADEPLKRRIERYIREGRSLRETAESVGRSRSQVHRVVAQMGGVARIRRRKEDDDG